eukprot:4898064-Amphidinium_carterae.1
MANKVSALGLPWASKVCTASAVWVSVACNALLMCPTAILVHLIWFEYMRSGVISEAKIGAQGVQLHPLAARC